MRRREQSKSVEAVDVGECVPAKQFAITRCRDQQLRGTQASVVTPTAKLRQGTGSDPPWRLPPNPCPPARPTNWLTPTLAITQNKKAPYQTHRPVPRWSSDPDHTAHLNSPVRPSTLHAPVDGIMCRRLPDPQSWNKLSYLASSAQRWR